MEQRGGIEVSARGWQEESGGFSRPLDFDLQYFFKPMSLFNCHGALYFVDLSFLL